jgi:hypothetical protein
MRLPRTFQLPEITSAKFREALLAAFGNVRDAIGTDGLTGILTLDDGANWRVVLTFRDGKLTAVTTGASTGATATFVE